jgi:hypothetical protein
MPQQLEERQNLFYLGAGLSPLRRLDTGIQGWDKDEEIDERLRLNKI